MLCRFLNKTLVCQDCNEEFIWSVNEQEFYAVAGFGEDPRRCPACRRRRRLGSYRCSVQHHVICADCGAPTTVPFVPRKGSPVYCRQCKGRTSHLSLNHSRPQPPH
jgi:CxxC-x17-CxxC domain-containing protein